MTKSYLGKSALSRAHVYGIFSLAFAKAAAEGQRKRQSAQNSTHMGKSLADLSMSTSRFKVVATAERRLREQYYETLGHTTH